MSQLIVSLREIAGAYTDCRRHYHNLLHIQQMFQDAKRFGIHLIDVQVAAIWGHDIVYVPGAPDNEEQSADLTCSLLAEEGACRIVTDAVREIILCTKNHVPTCDAAKDVIDLDLAPLGYDNEAYCAGSLNVYKEAKAFIPDLDDGEYVGKRIQFLAAYLAKLPLYTTVWGSEAFDRQARVNMKIELRTLQEWFKGGGGILDDIEDYESLFTVFRDLARIERGKEEEA